MSGMASLHNPSPSLDRLNPRQIRVVDVELTDGSVTRRDCYDKNDGRGVYTVNGDGFLFVRAVRWNRSVREGNVTVGWEQSGTRAEQVERIRVYTWPEAELLEEVDPLN